MNWIRHIIILLSISVLLTADPPDELEFEISMHAAYYYFSSVTINGIPVDAEDWVGAFNGNICVGSRQWDTSFCNSGICDVPAMGDDGSTETTGYMQNGDIPTFKIYDKSKNAYYDAIASSVIQGELLWGNLGMNIFTSLEGEAPGCTDSDACNYDSNALEDDGSCEYAEGNYDCDGNCIIIEDCNGDCGGSVVEDECGVCGGDGIAEGACDCDGHVEDCNGDCNGSAIEDDCGICSFGSSTHIPNVDMDCAGTCFGTEELDECGVCNGPGQVTCWDNSMACVDNCPSVNPPAEFQFNQSSQQAFYYFQSVTINTMNIETNDWVGAFNDLTCVGALQWDTSLCTNAECAVPVMGYVPLLSDETAGYMQAGEIPTFQIYDTSENSYYDVIASEDIPSWTSNAIFVINGLSCSIPELSIEGVFVPNTHSISNVYPNPFNPITSIEYSLARNTEIDLSIYNMNGRHIQILVQGFQTAGYHSIDWNASNYPSGVYFIKLESSDPSAVSGQSLTQTQKVVLVK